MEQSQGAFLHANEEMVGFSPYEVDFIALFKIR